MYTFFMGHHKQSPVQQNGSVGRFSQTLDILIGDAVWDVIAAVSVSKVCKKRLATFVDSDRRQKLALAACLCVHRVMHMVPERVHPIKQ